MPILDVKFMEDYSTMPENFFSRLAESATSSAIFCVRFYVNPLTIVIAM